jgi:YVTN family beta-propeller protein
MARMRTVSVVTLLAVIGAGLSALPATPAVAKVPTAVTKVPTDPVSQVLANGRQLTPAGTQVALGNYPTGAATTADGRFAWIVSAGGSTNDIRIVDLSTQRVCQVITIPGASGGIALDSVHRRAYVSGLSASRWLPTQANLPGAAGDTVQVFRWTSTCGQASLDRVIAVPPQPNPPAAQAFPPPRSGLAATSRAWPQRLAVSPDGSRLLVPLNLANSAAVVDLAHGDAVKYALLGSYPFGAAMLPGSHVGLVSNEASGTVSLINLASASVIATITVGPPLSHPQGIVVDRLGRRAYVALSASDQVVVIDLRKRTVERTISVGRSAGLGTIPVALALDPAGDRLYVAESGADELAVIRLPGGRTPSGQAWTLVGRIPTADQPQAVVTTPARGGQPGSVLYVAAEGMGVGPNPKGPDPLLPTDPIFWAFSATAPTTDVFQGVQFSR